MFVVIILSLTVSGPIKAQETLYSDIKGYVYDNNSKPLIGANVYLLETRRGTTADQQGRYVIDKIEPGHYTIIYSFIGYEKIIRKIYFYPDSSIIQNVFLKEQVYKMKDVVITPSSFSFSKSDESSYSFSSQELASIPDPSNDIFRKMQSVAGVETDNFNARIGVRGSYFSEMLYMIDGIEIYEPFHMKSPPSSPIQLEGLISVISDDIVESVDLSLGGFSAKYGNKSGGIFEINTLDPVSPDLQGSLSLSLMNAGVLFENKMKNHSFLFSARRGYFDFLINLIGAESNVIPNYHDLFFKYKWKINNSNSLFFNTLSTYDKYKFTDSNTDKVKTQLNENIHYIWTGWDYIGEKHFVNKLILFGSLLPIRMNWDETDPTFTDKGYNNQDAYNIGISNRAYAEFLDWLGIDFGTRFRYFSNDYKYEREYNFNKLTGAENEYIYNTKLYRGTDVNFYISNKVKISSYVLLEAGLRYDYQSYIPKQNNQFSPRLSLSISVPYENTIRFSYGHYYQPTDVLNLKNYIEKEDFKADRGIHYIAGIENNFFNRLALKLEAYYKDLQPADDYIVSKNTHYYINRSYARGIDLLIKYNSGNFSLISTYSLSTARDVALNGREFFRIMDKTHKFSLALVYKKHSWSFGLNTIVTTGYPYTSMNYKLIDDHSGFHWEKVYSEYKAVREEPYQRIDLSVSKEIDLNSGRLVIQMDIINLLNHQSIYERKWSWSQDSNGNYFPYENNSITVPFIPSLGIKWEF